MTLLLLVHNTNTHCRHTLTHTHTHSHADTHSPLSTFHADLHFHVSGPRGVFIHFVLPGKNIKSSTSSSSSVLVLSPSSHRGKVASVPPVNVGIVSSLLQANVTRSPVVGGGGGGPDVAGYVRDAAAAVYYACLKSRIEKSCEV